MNDDRIGLQTHFDQHWNVSLMPALATAGAGWIRDTIAWPSVEATKGVYALPAQDQGWLVAAQAQGLKVLVCFLYRNALYTDPYDPTGYANAAAWLAKALAAYSCVKAIEILNEPNNDYAAAEGTGWQAKYVTLANQAYAAIKAANPAMLVVGGGAQLTDNLAMLSGGLKLDAFSDHPYPPPHYDPALVYESGTTDYLNYRSQIAAATTMPIWETEWGVSTSGDLSTWNIDEYQQAQFMAQRLFMSLGSGQVARTFYYDYADEGYSHDTYTQAGITTANTSPKQAAYVLRRFVDLLGGVAPSSAGVQLVINGTLPQEDPPYTPKPLAYTFGPNIAVAFVTYEWPYYGHPLTPATLSWNRPNAGSVTALNIMSGKSVVVPAVQSGSTLSVQIQIGQEPILYIAADPVAAGGGGPATPTLSALIKELISLQ